MVIYGFKCVWLVRVCMCVVVLPKTHVSLVAVIWEEGAAQVRLGVQAREWSVGVQKVTINIIDHTHTCI